MPIEARTVPAAKSLGPRVVASDGSYLKVNIRVRSSSKIVICFAVTGGFLSYSNAAVAKTEYGLFAASATTYISKPSGEDDAAFERLESIVLTSKSGRVFALDSCPECRGDSFKIDNLPERKAERLLDRRSLSEVKEILASRQSFVFGFSKSCTGPFNPDMGLEFDSESRKSVLLIMRECQWARLLSDTDTPSYLYNFGTQAFSRLMTHLRTRLNK
jgi:hypothetical protein